MQVLREFEGHPPTWEDIAVVSVPERTKRSTVIAKAIETGGDEPRDFKMSGAIKVRVLDEASAHETPVEWEQPAPRLKIGA